MASSNKTPNIGLSKWSGADKPKRDDFNEDNRIIDEEIGLLKAKLGDLDSIKLIGFDTNYFNSSTSTYSIDANNRVLVQVEITSIAGIPYADDAYIGGALPVGFRPKQNIRTIGMAVSNISGTEPVFVMVGTDGIVRIAHRYPRLSPNTAGIMNRFYSTLFFSAAR